MTTIQDVYAAINPMPAMLAAKGKVKPEATFLIEANTRTNLMLTWEKPFCGNSWEREYKHCQGDTFEQSAAEALAFINDLPSSEQAKLRNFMSKLGSLIDAGKDEGIDVDYLNPLLDTMKRLSENALTYQPERA